MRLHELSEGYRLAAVPLRKKLRQAKKILEESTHVYELLQEEHRLEQAAYQRFRERMK